VDWAKQVGKAGGHSVGIWVSGEIIRHELDWLMPLMIKEIVTAGKRF